MLEEKVEEMTTEQNEEVVEAKKESKIKSLIAKLPKWNKPSEGNYLTLKEWLFFIIGGMGVMGVTGLLTFVTLQQGIYLAAARNINVDHVAIIGAIVAVVAVLTTPLASWLIDNTNTKFGKFRPYLIILPIPIVLCYVGIGLSILIENYWVMLITYTLVFNVLNFLNRIYLASFNGIIQVVSPKMSERTQLMSIGTFFTSLGPTITGFLFPTLANFFYSGDIAGSGASKPMSFTWILPLMVAIFAAIGIIVGFFVKERAVISKTYKQKVKFFDGVKKTAENKYFWIFNISNIFNTMKMFVAVTFPVWYITYIIAPELAAQGLGSLAEISQSLIMMLINDSAVPGMLLAPLLIKKFGKKKLNLVLNFGIAISLVPMLIIQNVWLHLVCIYLMMLFNGLTIVIGPACQTEINDYQQFKTGDRIEGFLTQFGTMFLTIVTVGTNFIAPAVYKNFGYIDDKTVLYDKEVLFGIVTTMCIISMVCAICAAIPYFFWDMTEKRHREIMEVLAIRVKYEDGEIDLDTKEMLENEALNGNIEALSMYEASIAGNVEGANESVIDNVIGSEQSLENNTQEKL